MRGLSVACGALLAGALLVCLPACSSSSPGAAGSSDASVFDTGTAGDDASRVTEAGPAEASSSTSVDVGASQGDWTANADVTLTGEGSGDLGAIAISHGVGTITFQGTAVDTFYFVGTGVPLGDAGADSGLAQERDLELVAVQSSRVILVWVTCDDADLAYVYYESTDGLGSTQTQEATGTCAIVDQPTTETVNLPAIAMDPPVLVPGYALAGAQLSYDGTSAGQATFDGTTWATYPFHVVDCTTCADPGWYELHSLFYDGASHAACAGILYLFVGTPSEVELAYLVCLPGVTSPIPADGLVFDSSWTKG